jgi:endonuclease/exonuclease/phosphatase family metal-dependent hydrolase
MPLPPLTSPLRRADFGAVNSLSLLLFLVLLAATAPAAETFRVAVWNVENYLDAPSGTRPAKPPESRAKVRDTLLAIRPDVVALTEMGGTNALLELRESLRARGLDLLHWEHVVGADTNIHVAVLSRFPIAARRPHTADAYLLHGRRFPVARGFAEVDVRAGARYDFTLLVAHLKSRRVVAEGDEEDMREQEALLLRAKVDAVFARSPQANLVVCGDFNDTKDSRAVRALMGRAGSRAALVDTRPAERNGDTTPARSPRWDPPRVTWTHYFAKEDIFSRFDYVLLSAGMAREWVREETHVFMQPDWALASDHRPLVVTFTAEDRAIGCLLCKGRRMGGGQGRPHVAGGWKSPFLQLVAAAAQGRRRGRFFLLSRGSRHQGAGGY